MMGWVLLTTGGGEVLEFDRYNVNSLLKELYLYEVRGILSLVPQGVIANV